MPRRRRLRKIVAPPGFRGYKPYGINKQRRGNNHVELLYEEYEAIKLADFDFLNHQDASEKMGISRATFARIYESARRKLAKALVETREIKTVFGNAWMEDNWFICNECHSRFSITHSVAKHNCPMCESEKIEQLKNKI